MRAARALELIEAPLVDLRSGVDLGGLRRGGAVLGEGLSVHDLSLESASRPNRPILLSALRTPPFHARRPSNEGRRVRALADREEAEHRRLVSLAVVLPLALPEPERDGLRPRERQGRDRLLELPARLPLEHEAVDRRLVGDDERVSAGLEGL